MRSNTNHYHLMLGDKAPSFVAQTTQGEVRFPDDYRGKWVILFSHPAAFTPVCTTEFLAFARQHKAFKALNTELLALSTDMFFKQEEWLASIREVKADDTPDIEFPVIADEDMSIANAYGMIHPEKALDITVRAVFIIDPVGVVQSMIHYPVNTGRSIDEIMRQLKALQRIRDKTVATPAEWKPGDDLIVMPEDAYAGDVEDRKKSNPEIDDCFAWYLCTKKDKDNT